jgi:hypothetical protein
MLMAYAARTSQKVAPKTTKVKSLDRTQSAWLVRDDEKLIDFVLGGKEDVSVFEMAEVLHREPISVLCRLRDGELATMVGFEFAPGSEEEAELFGLALSGVPMGTALRWCLADDDRSSAVELRAAMTTPDLRPAMNLVRDLNLWFNQVTQLEALRVLASQPLDEVKQAVAAVLARFEPPTPQVVAQQLFGVPPIAAKPYPWATHNVSSGRTHTTPKTWRRKSTRSSSTARKSGSRKRWTSSAKSKY